MCIRSLTLILLVLVPFLVDANMLTNASFELPATGNDFVGTGWTGVGEAGRHTWAAHDGGYGAAMQGWAGPHTGVIYQVVNASSGTYTFAVWVRAEEGYNPVVTRLKLGWYDATDAQLQADTVAVFTGIPIDDDWHHIYVTGTCTSQDLAKVRVEIESEFGLPNPGSTAMFVDDAELYAGDFVPDLLANGSFERPDNTEDWHWRASKWRSHPEGGSDDIAVNWESWTSRSGSWVLSLKGDKNIAANYTNTIHQNLVCDPGTYTFAVWIQRQSNFALSNAELRIEWFDSTFTNKVQPDTTVELIVSNDWQWHEHYLTGTCTSQDLYEARATMYFEWAYVTNTESYDMVMEDARFLNGTYTGRSARLDWAYHGGIHGDPRVEEVPGTNRFGTFMQVDPLSGTNTTYVITDSPEFAEYEGENGLVGLRTAWQNHGTGDWVVALHNMTRVTQVEISSADPFHGLPAAGVRTVDVWVCRWADPEGGTNTFPVFYAPYMATTVGVIQTTWEYIVAKNAEQTNHLGQLFKRDFGGADYSYRHAALGLHSALSNAAFEVPAVAGMENSLWQHWGEVGRADWGARAGSYGGVFYSWDPGFGGIYQDIATAGGTHTFSLWVKRQAGAHPTGMLMRLEWHGTNGLLQSDERSYGPLPADGNWYNLFISGTCTDAALSYVRPMFYSRFGDGTEAFNEGIGFDDAEFYTGSYTGGFGGFTNGGFETVGGSEYQAARWIPSNVDRAGREPWAFKSGGWGGVFRGWDTNQPPYEATLSQWVDVTPGGYSFTAWIRQEPGFWDTNVEMRIEWYDAGLNKLQADSVAVLSVTNDDNWTEYSLTGSCEDSDLAVARVMFFSQWDRNTNEVGRSMKIDDVTFVSLIMPDEDGDGIPDWWELLHFGGATNADASAHSDADTWSDGEEWVFDTDPTNVNSFLNNSFTNKLGATNGVMSIQAGPPTSPDRRYDIWWRTDITDNSDWTRYGLNVPGVGPNTAVILTVTNDAPGRVYRWGVVVP